MNCLDVIKQRHSCRRFKPEAIAREDLQAILQAALASPTGRDLQSLRFNVIESKEMLRQISDQSYAVMDEAQRQRMKERQAVDLFYGAPTVIVISAVPSPLCQIDAGIAAQSICLAAHSLGLGSCIIGLSRPAFAEDNPEHLRQAVGMAEAERYLISIAVGHPDMSKDPHTFDRSHIRYIS